ncbi:hypothetical protein [Streptomyces sp. NPDC018031]|uniref:hypothetical protein n=1 Tax=Streptomyces sp. NPDC018031 TaxID=3365033 RepID=UPI00378CBD23
MTGRTAATAAPDALGTATGWRLRPGVAVTVLRNGLHLRGRRGSVTLEGSTALPALWRLLEPPLRTGDASELLRRAEPDPALRKALDTLVAQLHAHDLLVAAPTGPAADWLTASAGDPALAAAAIAAAPVEVVGGPPGGALAEAAARALTRGGARVARPAGTAVPDGVVLLRTGPAEEPCAVAVAVRGGTGYVTAPGSPAQARADAAALLARTPAGDPDTAGPAAFTALLAGAAAHRLLCAAGGLPDPADEGDDPRLLPGLPAVLVAGARPPRADYRTWLGPDRIDADRRTAVEPARTLAGALARVAALGDERLGVLPAPHPGTLPQLPVPLAGCELPGGAVLAGAPRLDLARLDVFCRAAELRLGDGLFTVGANPGHAWGRALRRAARHAPAPSPAGAALPAPVWSGHPQAHHWWTTLTVRLGVRARLEVFPAGPEARAHHAVVRRDPAGGGRAAVLGRAVEAAPGDAAAFAALSAVAAVTAEGAGPSTAGPLYPSSGSVAPLAVAGARTAAWEDSGWTTGWLTEVAGREPALHTALHRLTGLRADPAAPVAAGARELAGRLAAFGFTVLATGEGER